MRSCPQCGARYTDDLRFCLHDGTTLVSAATDELSGLPTEQFNLETVQENNPSAFNTKPAAEDELPTVLAPPKTQKQYSFSAVDPASNMGCTMTFGKVAAALLFVAALGLIGVIFTYRTGTYSASVDTVANTYSPPIASANTNASELQPGAGGHSVSNSTSNTVSMANSTNVPAATPGATRAPDTTVTPQPVPTRETTVTVPKATPADPEPTPVEPDDFGGAGRVIRGGQLNGRALSLPQPSYPPAARAVGASGRVNVRVLVDDTGTVLSASAVSGHPLLRPAAAAAAMRARFPPLGRRGNRVTGIIVYNFIP
jgi:TonB family protein